MPPSTSSIPLPVDRFDTAREWLEASGLTAAEPDLRSGDGSLARFCPFLYYLQRRLGLRQAFSDSEALRLGSWAHKRLEILTETPDDALPYLDSLIKLNCERNNKFAQMFALSPGTVHDINQETKHSAYTAWAHISASLSVKVRTPTGTHQTWGNYLLTGGYRVLANELNVRVYCPILKTHLQARYDCLLYHEGDGTLWIADLKTTAMSSSDRLLMAPYETQCIHYLYTLQLAYDSGVLRDTLSLPAHARPGGMIHIAVEKPSIKFGDKDRPYHYHSHGARSGITGTLTRAAGGWTLEAAAVATREVWSEFHSDEPAGVAALHALTGKTPSRQYQDDADFRIYKQRCIDWFTGAGDYADLAEERQQSPCVAISHTPVAMLDSDRLEEYTTLCAAAVQYSTEKPCPGRFPRNAEGMRDYRKASVYAPFYILPVPQWPSAIRHNRLIINHRDYEGDL